MKKIKVEALNTIQQGGVLYAPGKILETSVEESKRLIAKKAARLHREEISESEEVSIPQNDTPEENRKKGK